MTDDPLLLVRATAKGVLDQFDHSIEFQGEDNFRIIYGPNGVGKTKFLEIIHATLRLDGEALEGLPFRYVVLEMNDGTFLTAQPGYVLDEAEELVDGPNAGPPKMTLFSILSIEEVTLDTWTYQTTEFSKWIRRNTDWRGYREGLWQDPRQSETASLAELALRFPEAWQESTRMPQSFRDLTSRVSSLLIETQRLQIEKRPSRNRAVHRRFDEFEPTSSRITDLAFKMKSLVNDAQTAHSKITQQLDRTFPSRVLLDETTEGPAESEVRDRYDTQNNFRSRLGRIASVSLENELSLPDKSLSDWELKLLSIYLDDADKKFEPFRLIVRKIDLYEEIINSRLQGKALQVTAVEGMTARRSDNGAAIDLDSLSSGEQHEIILMFQLLFEVGDGAMVLIDEPEISLHVAWQMAFIPDVTRIAELSGFRFIVATHSPQIINDAWSKAVALGPSGVDFT
jgi:AAA15 family ATPase/GTPase